MRYLYLFVFCLLLSVSVQAQKYVPFPKYDAVWKQSYGDYSDTDPTHFESGYWYHIKQEKDTLIDSLLYTLLSTVKGQYYRDQYGYYHIGYHKGLYGAMREDSFKHVYFYDLKDKKEHLLYDFNMKVGDTLPEYINNEQNYSVLKIDSVIIGTEYRKRYGIIGLRNDSSALEYIIEGIGSTQGLATDLVFPFEIIYSLDCFSLNGRRIFPDTGNYSCEIIVSVDEKDKKPENAFKIYPNPTSGQFTIQTQSIFSEGDICVRDVLGRIVLQEKLQSLNQTINITNQPQGLYFVELRVGEKRSIQKLILE